MKIIIKNYVTGEASEPLTEHDHVHIVLDNGEEFAVSEEGGRLSVRHDSTWHGSLNVQPHVANVVSIGCTHHDYPDESAAACLVRWADR